MIYIKNYIKSIQEEYSDLYNNPTSVLTHLLYVNGNGVNQDENGNIDDFNYPDGVVPEYKFIDDDPTTHIPNIPNITPDIEGSYYLPMLRLSNGYYNQYRFTEHTSKALLLVAIAMSEAYIMFMERYLDNPGRYDYLVKLHPSYDEQFTSETYNKDIKTLQRDVNKMKGFLK